jgi:hypothetical protein
VLGTLLMEHLAPAATDNGLPLQGQAAELAAALGPALRHIRQEQRTPTRQAGENEGERRV